MKKIVSMIAALAAGAALAVEQPPVQVVSFSSRGADTYANGDKVLDGECYALVWSPTDEFHGIAGDGTAKDPSEKVAYIGNFAKDGKCPYVEFHVSNDFFPGGKACGTFWLWVLDTRVFRNGVRVGYGKAEDGKVLVTAAAPAVDASVSVAEGAAAPVALVGEGARASKGTVDTSKMQPPVITGLSFEKDGTGAQVSVITLDQTVPGAQYAIQGAATPAMKDAERTAITTGTGERMMIVAPSKGNFYNAIVTDVAQ